MDVRFPITRTHLTALVFFAALNGCKTPTSDHAPEQYIENGQVWAFGSVELMDPDMPGSVMLKRKAGVQAFDNLGFELYGAVQGGGERDIAYADYHPTEDKVLAYNYVTWVEKRGGNANSLDVYAKLIKQGRSTNTQNGLFVWIGTAQVPPQGDAKLELAQGLHVSMIYDGVYVRRWALHYPDVKRVVLQPWQGMCPKDGPTQNMPGQNGPGQGPGQNPGQGPGQWETCRPLPSHKDLCEGDPTQEACRPKPPVQQLPGQNVPGQSPEPPKQTTGLETVNAEQGVYIMNADVKEAKIVFTAREAKAATDEENAAACSKKFFAVARSVDNVRNDSCVLTPAPASAKDGKLTCALTVSFLNANTYMEKVCNVTATFRGLGPAGADDGQRIQILKR